MNSKTNEIVETVTQTILTPEAFAEYARIAGGRHKAFVLARREGYNNSQIAEAAGNAGGAPTVAFALTALRNKFGIKGREDKDMSQLAEACGVADHQMHDDSEAEVV